MKRSELNLKAGDDVVYTDDGDVLKERVLHRFAGGVTVSCRRTLTLCFSHEGRTNIPEWGVSHITEVNGETVTED